MTFDSNLQLATITNPEALTLCLALGTLSAIRSGSWPAEAGIWTLARPGFIKPLKDAGLPDEILAIFRTSDELQAIQELTTIASCEAQLDSWIAMFQSRLATLPEKSWQLAWGERSN
ncbi:MAG: hypothetical protein ACO1RA_20735 [Planctomycetaceae bacterium]